uniref:Uncharacterized protein n=1 Tax=Cyprinus carpio TaxID=7962 RepID=A0A8C2L4C0_CYPCA
MVGKIKRVRQKLHHGAVKLENEHQNRPTLGNLEKIQIQPIQLTQTESRETKLNTSDSSRNNNSKGFSFPSGVFAGTKISPESLVQTLKVDEPSKETKSKQPAGEHKGTGEKKQQSKKEKMKERRERWLNSEYFFTYSSFFPAKKNANIINRILKRSCEAISFMVN